MKKNSKKNKKNPIKKINNKDLEQNKTTAKIVLTVFGLGPIIGIIIFLASKGFFNSPQFYINMYLLLKIQYKALFYQHENKDFTKVII